MTSLRVFVARSVRALDAWIHKSKTERQAERQAEAVISTAIDRVVERADPRIRLVAHYQRKLRPAVKRSLQYIDGLVANIPGPIEVNSKTWSSDPSVNAFFATVGDMQRFFSRSAELREFFEKRAD
jgi:hypothetical protein